MSEDKCAVCEGSCKFIGALCLYCNGTGEKNNAATAYIKNHICQCITLDRKFCPVCKKKCHHDSSSRPKQTIEPRPGGISYVDYKTVKDKTEVDEVTA